MKSSTIFGLIGFAGIILSAGIYTSTVGISFTSWEEWAGIIMLISGMCFVEAGWREKVETGVVKE